MTTFLRPIGSIASTGVVGEAWVVGVYTLDASTGDPDGTAAPAVLVTGPDGSTSAPTPEAGALAGYWTVTATLDMSGRWIMHVSTPDDALDLAAYALGPTTEAGMPTANDCVAYAREQYRGWDTSAIQDALDAERGAQRDKCGERNPYPDQLRQALLRRVLRNLAMRALPFAIATGDAESGPTILPGQDPEVRRLEGPWRKLVIG